MRRLAAVAIAAMAMVWGGTAGHAFERGINISSVFTYPQDTGWPPFRGDRAQFSDDEMRALHRAGFDFLRLPVDPSPFFTASPTQTEEVLADVADFVRRANDAGLAVIVSGHPTHSDTAWHPASDGDPARARFEDYAGWLEALARAVDAVASPHQAAIGLMNEPQPMCVNEEGTDWQAFQSILHERIRALTDLPIVLTGGCWSQIEGLEALSAIPQDDNTLFDVHYYLPFAYTHQGSTWSTPILAYVGGLRFPPHASDTAEIAEAVRDLVGARHEGSEAEQRQTVIDAHAEIDHYLASGPWPEQIAQDLGRLSAWADMRGIDRRRILMGEFGAIRPPDETQADRDSRAVYLRAMREAIEEEGFAWAMWEYLSPFGITRSDEDRRLLPDVVEALGLAAAGED